MSYENPEVPHEVNVGRGNALVEFLRLIAGLAVVVVAASALYFSSSWDPIGRGGHDKAAGTVVVASR